MLRSPIDSRQMVFGTVVRWAMKKGRPKMKPVQLLSPPEHTLSISRAIFDVVKEHGPLTISDTWDHVKEMGLRGLASKRQMKIMLRWMRERQKLRQICCHNGPHKQFLYTTWFTNPKNMPSPSPTRKLQPPKP
ncbi:thiamine-phosphate synthase [Rhynchospora pubera]|uniref:Thiamine-phosphate synthase n=1 Tax=Rhynchospora pubera TaxID=906938 RepID=A0AAV8GD88_9POAL|nr:thiamine-phosphate synthase [Rhynchospora pubera]